MNRISKYIVQSKIGVGGMGTVYKALDPYFDRIVAIKVMSPQLAADEEFRGRFFREARATAKLTHPNIVAVYDLGEENDVPYLVMEYLEGQDLKSMILSPSRISLEDKVGIMAQVCRGLAHAHDNKIIHRDIKPGNIFVTGSRQAKLLDFGLARVDSSVTWTTKGSILGTPSYMSPEQWAGSKVDSRSDIFAAGAVFYELLARKRAFAGDTYEQIFYNIFHSDPEPLWDINAALPPDLCRIVHRALAKDLATRYQTMHEILGDLEAFGGQLECAKSRLSQELAAILRDSGRLLEENREFVEGTPLYAYPADASAADYLQLLDLVDHAGSEQKYIASLVAKRKQAAPRLQEATMLENEGDPEQALRVIQGVLAEDPDYGRALEIRQKLDARLEQLRAEKARAARVALLTEQAADLLAADDPEGSLSLIAQALSLDPGHARARELRDAATRRLEEMKREEGERNRTLGLSLLEGGEFRESLAALALARERLGDDPDLAAALEHAEAEVRAADQRLRVERELEEARELQARGNFAAARGIVAGVLELSPQDSQAQDLLAEIGRAEEALRRNERIATLLTQSRQALTGRDFETAGIRVEEALLIDSENKDARALFNEIDGAHRSYLRVRRIYRRAAVILACALLISMLGVTAYLVRVNLLKRGAADGKAMPAAALPAPDTASTQPAAVDKVQKTDNEKQNPGATLTRDLPVVGSGIQADQTAFLSLTTNPAVGGAAVKVNDLALGQTDAAGAFTTSVKAGAAQIVEVEKEGYQRYVKSFPALKPGERRSFPVEMAAMPAARSSASLNITSEPSDATVQVDGAAQGRTPMQASVKPGWHKIEVKKPGYRSRERSSEFNAADYNLEFSLEQESGTLQFSVEPPGTVATINGQNYDTDLQKRIALSPGNYTILLSKSGYIPREHRVSVSDGLTVPLAAKLEKALPPAEEFGDSFLTLANWTAPPDWRAERQALVARAAGTCWLKEKEFENFTMKFSIRLTNGVGASWILRARDPSSYYRVELRGDAYPDPRLRNTTAFHVCADGKETEVRSLPIPVEAKKLRDWFQTIVEVRENRFRIDVSGKLLSGTKQEKWTVADFRDPQSLYASGKIGFRVSGSEVFEVNGLLIVPSK